MEKHSGILSRDELSADCIVHVDADDALYLPDEYVNPPLPDGKYDLEIQYPGTKHHRRFIRANGSWKEWVAQGE